MDKKVKQSYSEKNKGPFFAVLSSLCYGINNPLAAYSIQNGIPTIVSVSSRALFLFSFALILAIYGKLSFHIPREIRKYVVIMSISTGMISLCYVGSINFIPVSLAAIIFFTFPIQILLVSIIRGDHNIKIPDIIIFLIVFSGLIFVIVPDFNNINPIGILLAGISSICATFLYFSSGIACKKSSPIILGFWVHLGIIPILIVALILLAPQINTDQFSIFIPVLILSTCYIGAYCFQMLSLKYTSAVISGLFFNTEPILTAIAAAIILDERLLLPQYIGGMLIFASLIFVSIRK
ncbi:MAG: DMT family transporter [Hyphomicrobiales bacterium]|nr:DMT family transporter [Hyphomicrobiales bacterium]